MCDRLLSTIWRDLKLPMCVCRVVCIRLLYVRTLVLPDDGRGESGKTGNYPRIQLIHILSSVLAQRSRVIWECDRHSGTHTHTHKMRAYDACWTDLWCRIMNTLHLPVPPSPRARLHSGSIFSLNLVSDAKKPILTAFSPAAFRQPWQFISQWKWLMYMQITKAWARIQIWETAIRRQ